MPYGLPKNLNTKENERWVEECVQSVKNKNPDYSKSKAIRICKSQLIENRGNRKQSNININKLELPELDEFNWRQREE